MQQKHTAHAVSDYEKQRERNIASNNERLAELGLLTGTRVPRAQCRRISRRPQVVWWRVTRE